MPEQYVVWALWFSLYKWCPRNPEGESSLEGHQHQGLVHHWYQGRPHCTLWEALPPGANLPRNAKRTSATGRTKMSGEQFRLLS